MPNVTLEYDQGTLVLSPPGLRPDLIPAGFVVDPRIDGRYRAQAHLYRRAVGHLARTDVHWEDGVRQYGVLELSQQRSQVPFPHQQEALEAWEAAERRGIVVLPTGAGKSYVAELAILAVQRSTLVVVPTLDLMAQWARSLSHAFGVDVGMVGGGEHRVESITITTYDSAYRHMDRLGNRFGLIVFDEVHHLPSDTYSQAAALSIAPYRLGLTATLERSDGAHDYLDPLLGPVVYRQSVSNLRGDYLSEYDVHRIEVELSADERQLYEEARAQYLAFLDKHNIRMGGANGWRNFLQATNRSAEGRTALKAYRTQRQVAMASSSKLDQLAEIFGQHVTEPCIFFAHDNRTVYEVSRRFLVPVITHETPAVERQHLLDGLASGQYRVLGTSRVLNEGVDMPDVSVGVVLSGTGSVREHVQRLGRILRRKKGKRATLYELVTKNTIEPNTSRRRREHEAYQ